LRSVLCELAIADDPLAIALEARAPPADQQLERRFAPVGCEYGETLIVQSAQHTILAVAGSDQRPADSRHCSRLSQ
jgi:hypothetical protein